MPQLGPYILTAGQANRFSAAVGVALGLVDGNNQPRNATQQECDAWMRTQAISLVRNTDLNAAIATISEPAPLTIA